MHNKACDITYFPETDIMYSGSLIKSAKKRQSCPGRRVVDITTTQLLLSPHTCRNEHYYSCHPGHDCRFLADLIRDPEYILPFSEKSVIPHTLLCFNDSAH